MAVSYTDDQIRKTFIDPLRSVLLIDDVYPRYEELAESVSGTGAALPEHLRTGLTGARAMVDLFHSKNLVCDIENRPSHILERVLDNIGKSDLVVLDFHLRRTDHTNTTEALQILSKLSEGPHGNLVIVHTSDKDLDDVRFTVGAYLRGYLTPKRLSATVESAISTWKPEFSSALVEQHLAHGAQGWKRNVAEFRKQLNELGVPPQEQQAVIENVIEEFLRAKGAPPTAQEAIAPLQKMRFSSRGAAHKWLSFKNVFVAFMAKGKDEQPAANILDELIVCLKESSPTLLRMLLVHAKTKLEQGGFSYEDEILNSPDPLVHAAWLYQLLERGDDGTIQLDELLARMFASLQPDLIEGVTNQAADLISEILRINTSVDKQDAGRTQPDPALQDRHCQMAVELAGANPAPTAEVLHALNSYLSLEQVYPKKLTSGTIFALATEASDPAVCWVCVTAACDMEPREPGDQHSWHREIYPTKSVLTLKLFKTSMPEALQGATFYRSLFVPFSDKRLAFKIMEDDVRQPRTQMLFVIDNAKLDQNGEFSAYSVKKGAANTSAIQLQLEKYKVIAQLRGPYADRLLQETGHHSSRIGVDFVNLLYEKQRAKKEVPGGPAPSAPQQAAGDQRLDKIKSPETSHSSSKEPAPASPPRVAESANTGEAKREAPTDSNIKEKRKV